MSDTLTARKRETSGTRASRKLRAEGEVPAILYGHKETPESLALSARRRSAL